MTLKNDMGLFLYECPICHKYYKSKNSIRSHFRKYHPNEKITDIKRVSKRTYEYIETKTENND